ncbi:heme-binding protein [Streptomyces sp. NPDC127079]
MPVPGGFPNFVDKWEVIGGIGVGGADGDTDDRLADVGLKSIADLLA